MFCWVGRRANMPPLEFKSLAEKGSNQPLRPHLSKPISLSDPSGARGYVCTPGKWRLSEAKRLLIRFEQAPSIRLKAIVGEFHCDKI